MTCPFIIVNTNKQCKNNTKGNNLCNMHKNNNSVYIIGLEKQNEELNNIIQRNKIAYDDNFKKYHELLQEYNKVMESAKTIMDYNIKFKEEIKNLNKTIEKKNTLIKELKQYEPKEKKNTQYIFLKFDELIQEFKEVIASHISSMATRKI